MLFAIDKNLEEIIVSDSRKNSNKINFIDRIKGKDNPDLYLAVDLLTNLSKASNFDNSIFKAVDKVCQMLYNRHMESKK